MSEMEKRCGNCAFSCYPRGETREHCSNPDYNAITYTHEMLMEDKMRRKESWNGRLLSK